MLAGTFSEKAVPSRNKTPKACGFGYNTIFLSFYEGGSIYNGNTLITPPTKALEFYAICGTKDQGLTF